MLPKHGVSKAFHEVFQSMLEGQEYELLPDTLDAYNQTLANHGYDPIGPFGFAREGDSLLIYWNREAPAKIDNVHTFSFNSLVFILSNTLAIGLALVYCIAIIENQIRPVMIH